MLYRLSEFVVRYWHHKSRAHHQPVSDALQATAKVAWTVIDWIPARTTAISFAVVGSFEDAIEAWRSYSAAGFSDNDGVILAATAGAVNIKLSDIPAVSTPQASGQQFSASSETNSPTTASGFQTPTLARLAVIVGLVWRTVVMWMVLLALLTMARLLG